MTRDAEPTSFYEAVWIPKAELMTPEEERLAAVGLVEARAAYWLAMVNYRPYAESIAAFIQARMDALELDFDPEPVGVAVARLLERTQADRMDRKATREAYQTAAKELAQVLAEADLDCTVADALRVELVKVVAGEHNALGIVRLYPRFPLYVEHATRCKAQLKRAIDRFAKANLRLVMLVAKRLYVVDLEHDDRIQFGTIGLLKAVRRFDHRKGFRFSTYAAWWIRHSIQRGGTDAGRRHVRIPTHLHTLRHRVNRAKARLYSELGRPPTELEVAAACKTTVAKVAACDRAFQPELSIDSSRGKTGDGEDDARSLIETWGEDPGLDEYLTDEARRDVLRSAMMRLEPMHRDILEQRYGFGDREVTLQELGEKYTLSRERIRQIQVIAERVLLKILRPKTRHERRSAGQEQIQVAGDRALAMGRE